jgi:hypothetical protein
MGQDLIRTRIEEKMGPVTREELEFAIEQLEKNCSAAGQKMKLYDSTAYDMLITSIDFYRRTNLVAAEKKI